MDNSIERVARLLARIETSTPAYGLITPVSPMRRRPGPVQAGPRVLVKLPGVSGAPQSVRSETGPGPSRPVSSAVTHAHVDARLAGERSPLRSARRLLVWRPGRGME